MEYAVGIGVAVLVCAFAALVGFDRERSFYSTLLVVVAHYYILFAAMAGSVGTLALESVAAAVFLVMAAAGFRKNPWLIVAGLIGHGVFDFFHHRLIQNAGVPAWWPGFCLAFDVLAGGVVAMLLLRRARFAAQSL